MNKILFGIVNEETLPIIKKPENKPVSGKTYRLTGGSKDKCISNGNTWAESEVTK